MMRKCSVREIENNYSVSHGIFAKLTSTVEFSDAEDLAKQYGGITGYAIFKITDFSYCLRFFTIFCLDKKFSPYFPFHNVGRSAYKHIYSNHTHPYKRTHIQTRIQTHKNTHTNTHTNTYKHIHAAIRKNGREGLVIKCLVMCYNMGVIL